MPTEYGELLSEEMGFISRDVEIPAGAIPDDFLAVIIGARLSGLCMAVKLAVAGVGVVILEKDEDLGGTWLENVYPGVPTVQRGARRGIGTMHLVTQGHDDLLPQ